MKIIDKKPLWTGKFLRSVLINYSDPRATGHDQEAKAVHRDWESIERVNCDGVVAIVPLTEDGHLVLIRQFRPPVGGHVVEIPAGLCSVGETLRDAALRELIEETGYAAGSLHFLTEGPLSSGMSSEMLAVFLATDLVFEGIGNRDETEDIEVLKVPLESLYEELKWLERRGNLIDLKVYGLVELAKNFLSYNKERGQDLNS